MRFFLFFLIAFLLSAAPVFSSGVRGRLSQILEIGRKPCASGLEGIFESASEPTTPIVLDTTRFQLRGVTGADFEAVKKIWGDAEVAKMSGDYMDDHTIMGLLHSGTDNADHFRRGSIVNMGIYEDGKLIGMCQLASTPPDRPMMQGLAKNYNENWAEISYHLAPSAWGKGVASEVATKLVETAFTKLGVQGVHAQALVSNDGSQKVLKKAGLVEIDRFLDPSPWGHGGGSVYFAVKREDYKKP